MDILKVDIETAKKRMKKMFNIMSYQKNANQNYNEVSPHICQNGHHQKIYTELSATECVEKRGFLHCWGNVHCYSHYGER